MIGTTDIRFDQDPDDARCDIGEVDYLLGEVNSLIPEANLTLEDVLYTFSGVRPLPYVPDKAESAVPRSHVLHDHGDSGLPGLVTIVGGKLTTYRQLAEDTVDDAFSRLLTVLTTSAGEEKETVRVRLLELFEVVGTDDPRVAQARVALANALF